MAFAIAPRLGRAQPVLAFGKVPSYEISWISTILQENGIAFVARHGDGLLPMNDAATSLPLFS